MKRCFIPLTLLFLFNFRPVSGQEMLGMTLGNYAGVNSIQLNPSAIHNSKTYLDVQFLGAGLFLQNNYLYQSKSDYKFVHFFQSGYEWPTHIEDYAYEVRIFYHYDNERDKNVYSSVRINGPGAMLIWGNHAFALFTAARSVFSLHNVPFDVANFAYLGFDYWPQHNINYQDNRPFSGAGMAWGEIGLTYSYKFFSGGYNQFAAGISIRRLFGYAGLYVNSRQFDYVVINDSTLNIRNMDAQMGFSLPVTYTDNSFQSDPLFRGGGFGFDVGITYQRLKRYHQKQTFTSLCGQRYEDYIYRIGIAVIDVGGIQFKTNAMKYNIDNRSSYWTNVNVINFRNIANLMDTISYKFYGDSKAALVGEKFTLWLPSALSIQFDYRIKENWYVNASLIYGFNFSRASLSRPSELSITPRYESKWFEASLPVSLYDWYLARIGLALRFYNVTIGTEKLGGFFNLNDFTGLDFYCSIKLFFNKGSCRSEKVFPCGNLEFNH